MEKFVVRMDRASSLSGTAFVGPGKADGFKVEDKAQAAQFDNIHEAARVANAFKNRWRGFHGFHPADITVEVS